MRARVSAYVGRCTSLYVGRCTSLCVGRFVRFVRLCVGRFVRLCVGRCTSLGVGRFVRPWASDVLCVCASDLGVCTKHGKGNESVMWTRFQKRVHVTHQIMLSDDLLSIILPHVSGGTQKQCRVYCVLPCVCRTWEHVWTVVLHGTLQFTTSPSASVIPPHLSLHAYDACVQTLERMTREMREKTQWIRSRLFRAMSCIHQTVPSFLGILVVELALGVPTPHPELTNGTVVPSHLWIYVRMCRKFAAKMIYDQRTRYPRLPPWYPITPTDFLHAVLVSHP